MNNKQNKLKQSSSVHPFSLGVCRHVNAAEICNKFKKAANDKETLYRFKHKQMYREVILLLSLDITEGKHRMFQKILL